MKKKLVSILLCLCMALTLLPTSAMADGNTHSHYLCGDGDACTKVGHTCSTKTTFTAWGDKAGETTSLPTEEGSYYLTGDVTLTAKWEPVNGTVLCLNGHTITDKGGSPVIGVKSGVTFTLTDCATISGKITHESGKAGFGVNVESGTFNMYAGTISENSGGYCGGVYVHNNETTGTFNMYGGSITGNSATDSTGSGGVKTEYTNTFNMYGGEISGNTASNGKGGGVYVNGKFNMSGGSISNNNAPTGGGVYVDSQGIFNVSGAAKVKNNTASSAANNVELNQAQLVRVTGALTGGAGSIGVTTANKPTEIKAQTVAQAESGYTTLTNTDAAAFTPDLGTDDYLIKLDTTSNYCLKLYCKTNSGTSSTPTAAQPNIITQPRDATYTVGATATALTVAASVTDGGILSYQWYEQEGILINGETSENYTPGTGIDAVGTTYYYCVVTNTKGDATATATSNVAKVEVTSSSSTPTVTPTVTIVYQGTATTVTTPKVGDRLEANVTGAPDNADLKFYWSYDDGATSPVMDGSTRSDTYIVSEAYVGKMIGVYVHNGERGEGNRASICEYWFTTAVAPASSTPSTPSTSGGSSSGGSSSGNTVTVPVSSDSASVNVKAEVSKGNATVNVSDKQIEQVANDGAGDVTIDVSGLKNVDSATVPSRVVEKTNEVEDTGLTVALPTGSVTLDETALESVTEAANGKDVTISVVSIPTASLSPVVKDLIGMEPTVAAVVDVNITANGRKQSTFNGGKLTVTIPYTPKKGEDTSKLTVWFIKDDGTIENKGGWYDAENKCFVFETDHLSQYLLVNTNELVTFTDVPADAYYAAAVNWASIQGITGGVDDTHFAPNNSCTRAQIVTFLYRWAVANGVDVSVGEDTNILSYNDAFSIPEYALSAFQWAVGAGIVQGNNGNLMPNQTCTRAQAVAFLFRFAASQGMDAETLQKLVSGFGDAAQVPSYALSAFDWALAGGIVQGNDGNLLPNNTCTRAQIVTFLYRLLAN